MEIRLLDEAKIFIRFLKNLNEKEQIGLNLTIEGLRLLAGKQKKAAKTASHCLFLPEPL